jgi:hypothetical protein
MKKLLSTALLTLLAVFLPLTAWASGKPGNGRGIHVFDSAAVPTNASVQGATHKFKVHVQDNPISELSIELPEDVSLSKNIEVTDANGQKIDAQASVNSGKATIVFAQPVPRNTVLTVNLRGVKTSGYEQNLLYRVSGKPVNLTAEIPLGTAEVRTYR